jgi:hypothetical protein
MIFAASSATAPTLPSALLRASCRPTRPPGRSGTDGSTKETTRGSTLMTSIRHTAA